MTKAKTAGQKRRIKRARRITLPGGDSVPQRPTGTDRWHTQQAEPPADAVALKARALRCPMPMTKAEIAREAEALRTARAQEQPDDRRAAVAKVKARVERRMIEDARDVLAADDMGRCIRAMRPGIEDRRALLTVWQGVSASWANYAARVLGKAASPQAAALPMLPEPMETDPSLRVDLRTADERDEAAIRSWQGWREAFNALPVAESLSITGAVYNTGAALWDADKLQPTRHGAMAVKALAALHERRVAS